MNGPQTRSQAKDYPFSARGQTQEGPMDDAGPQRNTMVMESMSQLVREVENLSGLARHLQERLQPVMRKEPQPQKENGLDKTCPMPCDLAAEIQRLARQVHDSFACLDETLRLLEI